VLSYQIAPELRAGKLMIVLSEFEPPPVPISVVYAEGRRVAAKVRAFVDFAVERLSSDKSLNWSPVLARFVAKHDSNVR